MANDNPIPPVVWAQRSDKLYVTLNVEDCKNADVKFSDKSLHFTGTNGQKVEYDFTLEFFKEIDTEKSKFVVLPRHIPMVIVKKDGGPYWPRLLHETTKVHWLKTDFDKWRDEDDSDVDESKDAAFEDMMGKMGDYNGGMGGMGGMGAGDDDDIPNEEDSDDEELPDLE
jgi:prostaglandin-E synthase